MGRFMLGITRDPKMFDIISFSNSNSKDYLSEKELHLTYNGKFTKKNAYVSSEIKKSTIKIVPRWAVRHDADDPTLEL